MVSGKVEVPVQKVQKVQKAAEMWVTFVPRQLLFITPLRATQHPSVNTPTAKKQSERL